MIRLYECHPSGSTVLAGLIRWRSTADNSDVKLDLLSAKYLTVASSGTDGESHQTAAFFVADGADILLVVSGMEGRRLAASGRAQVAPCSARGTATGPVVGGVITRLDQLAADRASARIVARYGVVARAHMASLPDPVALRIALDGTTVQAAA